MSNLEDGVSFYEKFTPFDLNKILPNNLEITKNESFSLLDTSSIGKSP